MKFGVCQSYRNGIVFTVSIKGQRYVISTRRDENGNICLKYSGGLEKNSFFRNKKTRTIVMLIFACFSVVLYNFLIRILARELVLLGMIVFLWVTVYLGFYCYSKNPKNASFLKYHASEHMAINFFERYNRFPKNIEELAKMDKLYISCGSTLIAIVAFCISMFFIMFEILAPLFFNFILIIATSIIIFIITIYIWGKGWLDFFQKLMVKTPSEKELEVALYALKEIEKISKKE